tara:strand:- start:19547 stop:19807 length:261 start_codon:yes stop_codon:yes gene_type:complete
MNIQDIKKEYDLTNEDISDMFGFKNVISYQNSSAKKRYENGLIAFNKVVKSKKEKPTPPKSRVVNNSKNPTIDKIVKNITIACRYL